jgi:UDP-glucose 4-epimerase
MGPVEARGHPGLSPRAALQPKTGASRTMRTILVTGGAGFIGSNLARLLATRGDRVRIIDDLSIGNLRYLDGVPHELVRASLADRDRTASAVEGVDAVVHLAARAGIPDSVRDPLGSLDANVTQTVQLLDLARRAGVRRFVLASSNAAAGDHEPPADETDLPHPLSPYGASKLAGEAYCQAFSASFGMAACALRFSNAYGPNSLHKSSVVAAWMRAALSGRPIMVNGDGAQTRDFVFVDDLAAAVMAALDAPEDRVAGEIFQVGTGRETTVNMLVDRIRAVAPGIEVMHGPARAGDVRRNVSRVEKAATSLGYRATISLEEGLARTAAWFGQAMGDTGLAAVKVDASSGSE